MSVFAADLDGDGTCGRRRSPVAVQQTIKIAWYENRRRDLGSSGRRPVMVSTMRQRCLSVSSPTWTATGDMDVLSASRIDDKIAWYENLMDGRARFGAQQVISTAADGAQFGSSLPTWTGRRRSGRALRVLVERRQDRLVRERRIRRACGLTSSTADLPEKPTAPRLMGRRRTCDDALRPTAVMCFRRDLRRKIVWSSKTWTWCGAASDLQQLSRDRQAGPGRPRRPGLAADVWTRRRR